MLREFHEQSSPQLILTAFMAAIVVRRYGLSGHFVVKQSQQISWPRYVTNDAAAATL
jgi:hypothetical protein